ncbi:MAG: PilZ domain-containing protein [Thermoanaerobaculia bacterium]
MADSSSRPDRRSQTRHAVTNTSGWFRLGAEFELVDVSLDGIGVQSVVPLQIGRVYTGTIEWEGERLSVTGRVAWSVLARTTKGPDGNVLPVYHSGIQFAEHADAALAERRRLLERATTYRPGDRLFGRYEVLPEQTRLELECSFRVCALSAGGMLIEAAEPFELETVLDLEVDLDGHRLRCRGRVASLDLPQEVDGQLVHRAGIEFLELDAAAAAALEAYLATLERPV